MRQAVSVLFAVIMLFLSIDVMAQKPKGQRQMTVDFTVNNDVISNYNTDSLRQTLYNPVDSGVFIISHRGDWHGTAENSLHSIQKAIEKGCAGVMVDVRKTKDGELVLMADETVDRMTNGSGRVADMTLSEIKLLRLKDYHGNMTPLQVPILEEALKFCKGKILIAVSNYADYKKDIDELVSWTRTSTEFISIDGLPRRVAQTWKSSIEQDDTHKDMKSTYKQLLDTGVTVFVTDAPKAFNSMFGISAEWPLVASDDERNAETADLLAKGGNIHYSHLTSGSHFDTWRVAYSFTAVRDWLFHQHK